MLQIAYSVPKVLEDAMTYSYREKVPIRRECPIVGPPFILTETDSWNCNLCGADMEFFIPYFRGDIFPMQTNFADQFNTNPAVLNYGIKANSSSDWYVMIELQDNTGLTISDLANTFCSEYWVGYDLRYGSIQTWFLNTAILPTSLKCWRLKITYYKINQQTLLSEIEREIYTEYFKEVEDCEKYVSVQSVYDTTDCYSNIYSLIENTLGTSSQQFYNFLRLEGEVEFVETSESVEIETDRKRVLRKTVTKGFRVRSNIVAPYFALMIDRAVRGSTITVNGVEYNNFTFDKNNDASKMWVIDLRFEQECTIDNRGCVL